MNDSDATASAIAIVQAAATIDDVERNLDTLDRLTARAAAAGADVVVTPELFATGYAPDRAWQHDGAEIRAQLSALARRHRVAVVGSTIDTQPQATSDEARHRIAATFFGPDGAELLVAHKRHLFGPDEKRWLTPAQDYSRPILWRGLSWGLGVCYDVEFPEFARAMAHNGAHALLIPTAVPTIEHRVPDASDAWCYRSTMISTLQVPAHALDNGVVIAYANHCGTGFTGHSRIVTPTGGVAAAIDHGEAIAVTKVTKAAIDEARAINTYLGDLSAAP